MAIRQPRYSKEEFAQRGDRLYQTQIKSQVETGNDGKIVAIDIETGIYEIADDLLSASKNLSARLPDAQTGLFALDTKPLIILAHGVLKQNHDARAC